MPKRIISGAKKLYMLVEEPRNVRIVYFTMYCVMLVLGVVALMDPPRTLSEWTPIWASFIVLGSLLGACSIFTGRWWVERVGTLLTMSGAASYASVVLAAHLHGSGNRVVQFCSLVALALSFFARYFMVRGADIEPGR